MPANGRWDLTWRLKGKGTYCTCVQMSPQTIQTHLKEETEANPLVISVVFLVLRFATRIINSFERNFFPHSFVEGRFESVGGVNPTESV